MDEKIFPSNNSGCERARSYLKKVGVWNRVTESMDGCSQVEYANKLHNQPKLKNNDTEFNKSGSRGQPPERQL